MEQPLQPTGEYAGQWQVILPAHSTQRPHLIPTHYIPQGPSANAVQLVHNATLPNDASSQFITFQTPVSISASNYGQMECFQPLMVDLATSKVE